MRFLLLTLLCVAVAAPAAATPPNDGAYNSSDLGGTMQTGLFSESWVVSGPGQIGNTVNAMSWDGVTLGGEWKVWCPAIAAAPVLTEDTRDGNGTGDVEYQTDYIGGYFWLSKNGPWGDGTEDYSGVLLSFEITARYQYIFGNLAGIRSNVTLVGDFDGYGNCMTYAINNAAFVGMSPSALPAWYPPFLDTSCATGTVSVGGWGTATQITLTVFGTCVIGTEQTTWGAVKARYR
jgi:hypothetical protein